MSYSVKIQPNLTILNVLMAIITAMMLVSFMALPWVSQVDDQIRVIGSSKLETNKVRWEHIPRPDSFKPTAYWQQWSKWRKLVFKAVAGQSLVDLGYAVDSHW